MATESVLCRLLRTTYKYLHRARKRPRALPILPRSPYHAHDRIVYHIPNQEEIDGKAPLGFLPDEYFSRQPMVDHGTSGAAPNLGTLSHARALMRNTKKTTAESRPYRPAILFPGTMRVGQGGHIVVPMVRFRGPFPTLYWVRLDGVLPRGTVIALVQHA